MEDILKDLEPLMQSVRAREDMMFPASFIGRAATITLRMLTAHPKTPYAWDDIRRDFQPQNADPFDPRNLEPAREVALLNVDYWIRYDGDEVCNIELASSLSSLRYLHTRNPGYDVDGTLLLMRDIQNFLQAPV